MSIDILQKKIRKEKNALMVDLTFSVQDIPPQILTEYPQIEEAYCAYGKMLLTALKGHAAAVRFRFSLFALLGEAGLNCLAELTKKADALGFYIFMDAPDASSAQMSEITASAFWGTQTRYRCDGILTSAFAGSDIIKPYLPYCADSKKVLFAVVRTPNKSAAEIQDLQFGSRQVHTAAADYINRFCAEYVGKSGYASVGICASATSAESLRNLRTKYPQLFIIADGMDYSAANTKNASFGFDKFGHGCILCIGTAVIAAWKKEDADSDPAAAAVNAADRIHKNLSRYITIL